MTSEGLGEMFEGDSADTCAGKIPLVPMGVRADGPVCAGQGARPPSALAEFLKICLVKKKWNHFNLKMDMIKPMQLDFIQAYTAL